MNVLNLSLIFLVIVVVTWLRQPLFLALSAGILTTIVLFRISAADALNVLIQQSVSWETIEMLLSFYLIIFVQMMLEKRGRLMKTQDAFDSLIRNPRLNTMISPAIMGLLPSAAVMAVCARMVDRSCGNHLDSKSKTFVSCYYRHIPEMFLPTFPVILLALSITKQNAGAFILVMLPLVLISSIIGYCFYVRKLPKTSVALQNSNSKKDMRLSLLRNLWALLAILLIIILFNIPVWIAAPIVIVFNYFIDRFSPHELPDMLLHSAEPVLLGNMYLVMLFKGIISHTGVLSELPAFFNQFPIPIALSFAFIFFFATIISGSQAIVALCLPMAFSSVPSAGLPLLVMLMGIAWSAMQISPTHICSFVAANYYHTSINDIALKGFLPAIVFSCACYLYYLILTIFF